MRYYATGRRKEAVAKVWLEEGNGKIIINGKLFDKYFTRLDHQKSVVEPLEVTGTKEKFNVKAKVSGGGISGQAGAVTLGIARTLVKAGDLREILKKKGLLKRDPRVKERKKYGLRKARRARQFSKR